MSTKIPSISDQKQRKGSLYVGALAKGLRVLRAFDASKTELSLADLSERTGLDKSAVQRLTNTLHLEGMLDKDPLSKKYRPSHMWLKLSNIYYWSNPLLAAALPKLIDLSQSLGETINLVEMHDDHIIYLYRLPCKRTQFSATVPGRQISSLISSSGRAILSTWPDEECEAAISTWPLTQYTPRSTMDRAAIRESIQTARKTGYVITEHEVILNEMAIATPIPTTSGRSSAAVQCSVSAHSWSTSQLVKQVLPLLQDAANGITV